MIALGPGPVLTQQLGTPQHVEQVCNCTWALGLLTLTFRT